MYCCSQDFAAQYRKTRSMENSRRPSEENIYLTPPWMEDERQSSGVSVIFTIIINFKYPLIHKVAMVVISLSYVMSTVRYIFGSAFKDLAWDLKEWLKVLSSSPHFTFRLGKNISFCFLGMFTQGSRPNGSQLATD